MADPTSDDAPLSAADILIRQLSASGISYFFANGGTDFPPIVEAYSRAVAEGVDVPEPVVVTHENAAVAMAHGYYLMSGEPQAVMVHVNVGTANAVNAVLDAARDNVPVLLMAGLTPYTETGRAGTRSQHIHWAQEMFDQAGMVREAVKWDYELHMPEQAADAVVRGLEIASSSPSGPVYLTLPRDVLAQTVPDAIKPSARAVPARPGPDAADMQIAIELVVNADNPLIITAGAGRTVSGFDALARCAERHAIPVVSFHQRYCNMSSDHPMHFGFLSGHRVSDADVIVVLDCDVPWIPSLDTLKPGVRIVHVGEDPGFARYPMRSFQSDLAIRSTAAAFLDALDAGLAEKLDRARVSARALALAPQWHALRSRWDELAQPGDGVMTAEYVSKVMGDVISPDAIVVNEYSLRPAMFSRTKPQSYFGLSPSGGLGWGLGAALGIKLAARERTVIAALGDGAYVFANPTACHWVAEANDLPVLTVIFNNRLYGAVRNSTLAMYPQGAAAGMGARMLADLSPPPAFETLVTASGGYGEKVERPEDLANALRRCLYEVEVAGRQAVLNVMIA